MPLNKTQADAHVQQLDDAALERLAMNCPGGAWETLDDPGRLAVRAVVELSTRRREAAELERQQQRANAERERAKGAYREAGLDPDADPQAFDRWYIRHRQEVAADRLEQGREARLRAFAKSF
jgi:hypothetical protein